MLFPRLNSLTDSQRNVAIAACVVALPLLSYHIIYGGNKKMSRKRSLSFTSSSMINGSFPPETNVPSPIICSMLLFENCPQIKNIVEAGNQLCFFERFRCCVVYDNNAKDWKLVEVKNMDIEKDHITTHAVGSEKEMQQLVQSICAKDLKNYDTCPPWMIHRIENVGTGMSALVVRIHHVVGDGMSLVSTIPKVFQKLDGTPFEYTMPKLMSKSGNLMKTPVLQLVFDSIVSFVRVLGLAVSPYDSDTKFTSQSKPQLVHGDSRKIIFFPTLKLQYIKDLKSKAGVTLNDVLLSATAGAIRRYCVAKSCSVVNDNSPLLCRALMPFAFPRSPEEASCPSRGMRNYWAFLSVDVPVGASCCHSRLARCHASTKTLKQSTMAPVQLWVQNNLVPFLPVFFARKTAHDVFSRHSMVFSNVPGPSEPAMFCGEKIMGLQAIFYNLLPQVIIISYGGLVFMNMVVDDTIVKDSDILAECLVDELMELTSHYGVQGWTRDSILAEQSPGKEFGILDTTA